MINNINKIFHFFALMIFLISVQAAQAADIQEVATTSPAWDTFTNKDGTGLYHEIMNTVFGLYNIPVRHIYSNSGRSEELVLKGEADVMTCDDKASPELVMGRYPMYENSFYVFFKKGRIGVWQGDESLRGREILSQPTFYNEQNFKVPVTVREIQTGPQALAMVLLDRSDFYVDDMTLIKQSIAENTLPYDPEDFDIKEAGRRAYFPLFNTTERGEAIRKMYEDGMHRLHDSGKLKPIYEKWGYQYPAFDGY